MAAAQEKHSKPGPLKLVTPPKPCQRPIGTSASNSMASEIFASSKVFGQLISSTPSMVEMAQPRSRLVPKVPSLSLLSLKTGLVLRRSIGIPPARVRKAYECKHAVAIGARSCKISRFNAGAGHVDFRRELSVPRGFARPRLPRRHEGRSGQGAGTAGTHRRGAPPATGRRRRAALPHRRQRFSHELSGPLRGLRVERRDLQPAHARGEGRRNRPAGGVRRQQARGAQPMAQIVAGFGVPHTPIFPHFVKRDGPDCEIAKLFGAQKVELAATRPDLIVMFDTDHLNTFFLDALPIFAIGIDKNFKAPNDEPRDVPNYVVPSLPALASHIRAAAVTAGYDVAMTQNYSVDHSVTAPLRVVVMGSGSFSLEVGGPRMAASRSDGVPDPDWAARVIKLLEEQKIDQLIAESTEHRMLKAGNVGGELLNWIAMLGAIGNRKPTYVAPQMQNGHAYGVWRWN